MTTKTSLPSRIRPKKLEIVSALYGLDGMRNYDLAEILQSRVSDSVLDVWVENDLSPLGDPVEGQLKRLKVKYSYGGPLEKTITRKEHEHLVLP